MFAKKEVSRNSLTTAKEVLNGFKNTILNLLAIYIEVREWNWTPFTLFLPVPILLELEKSHCNETCSKLFAFHCIKSWLHLGE